MSDPAHPARALPDLRQAAVQQFRPFCSKRCADVDLNRWLSGVYAVPVTEDDDEDGDEAAGRAERRSDATSLSRCRLPPARRST